MKDQVIEFEIERLDPLGQGVSKLGDKITFIPKTLPGEKGKARITRRSKGVQFAEVIEYSSQSSEREEPSCPHYLECSGCHYLHTNYEQEIQNKLSSLKRLMSFTPFSQTEIILHRTSQRLAYRNRVQLHYDKQKELLGFFQERSKKIIKVSQCQLPSNDIQLKLGELYSDNYWLTLIPPNAPLVGHLELYQKEKEVHLNWNQSYSSGGFTQVNQEMNLKALGLWEQFYHSLSSPKLILDLFGGSGNLSRSFKETKVIVVDNYCDTSLLADHQSFLQADLYKNTDPLEQFSKKGVDFLLLDPPRSGFKETSQWIEKIAPKSFGYQSCFPDTMARDIKNLSPLWKMTSLHLLDFFPGTHHYETLALFEKTEKKAQKP